MNLPISTIKGLAEYLKVIPQFTPIVEGLEQSALYGTAQNNLVTSIRRGTEITKLANALYTGAVSLLEMLRVAIPEERPESVSIKLPDTNNLHEIADILLTIEKALAQVVVNPTIQGEVRVDTWEPGTLWILIWLQSLTAVKVVGRLARSAAVFAQEIARWRAISAHVKTLEIKNDALENLEEAQQKLLSQLVDSEARAIEDSFFPSHDNERQERIKESIRTLSELIFKGAEIHPALTAPVEAKEVFPKYDELPTSTIKQLEDKHEQALPDSAEDENDSTDEQNPEANGET
jgi:hypothetical protein